MKCKGRFVKLFAVLVLGLAAVNLSLNAADNTVSQSSRIQPPAPAVFEVMGISLTSEPLAYLFQIIFILFFISPPLIVILLFLIWKELKARNKMK